MSLLRTFIRTKFKLMSRSAATALVTSELERYQKLLARLGPEACAKPVRVKPMLGVDEDMREWSIFMILEHNTIVQREVNLLLESIIRGEEYQSDFNPKTDVMPSRNPGPEQVAPFEESIAEHLRILEPVPKLRGGRTEMHSLFGPLDLHGWHCMFGVHLQLHRKQAEAAARRL